MLRFLPFILLFALVVYALIDCVRADDTDMPVGLPKALWVVLIVIFPGAGALAWLVVSRVSRQAGRVSSGGGRAHPSRPAPRRPAPRPIAPDDDPDFLASLDRPPPAEPEPEPPRPEQPDDEIAGEEEAGDEDGRPEARP